jgi:hypothetical protein
MIPAPNRRWSFTLRTLFVMVTVFGIWLGYQMNWIRQRERAIEDGEVGLIIGAGPNIPHPTPQPPPWTLRLFGAQANYGYGFVTSPDATDAELERLRALFPETTVDRPWFSNDPHP